MLYKTSLDGIAPEQLQGFFAEWPKHPAPERHLDILNNSDHVVVAVDGDRVVGFVNAITDKTLSAYIPLFEVLPGYQERGIGSELMKRMLEMLKDFYMVDLLCDVEAQPFYEQFGMEKATGMRIRNFDKQNGS